jgi:two-component system, cell cycle sensor histidine kinase and response regulator CckA
MDKQRFNILAVDDEPVNIQLMIAALKDDYDILTALSGQEAIELLEEQIPDLILLDVMMPDVSGYDVCKIIKADERLVEIPVIFLTSLDSHDGELQGLELGGIDYLTKPTNFDLLKLRIRNQIVQKARNDLMKEQVVQLARQKEELAQMLVEQKQLNKLLLESDANLKESNDRFNKLAEQSGTFVWEVDTQGLYTYVSHVSEAVLGYYPNELVGRMHFYDLHPEAGREVFKEAVLALFTRKEPFNDFENRAERKDGSLMCLSTFGSPILSANGALLGYRGSDTDITEKKSVMEQLIQSQKLESIGQLAGGVAHDFNNKLMVILGYAELSKMEIHDTDKILHYLDEIRRAAEQSRDITIRLLAFSRQQVISPQTLEANRVIADTLKSLSRLIGEHISISFEPFDNLWNIQMDPVQLDQVVMNLAINARDAMPDGGSLVIETGNITMDTESCRSIIDAVPGDYVMVTFSDSGTGMDKETLTHIFEPFFTTKEVGKGTGLGLATIHGITRQNNGFIDVTSNVGQGTEFKVYIPRFSEQVKESTATADTISTGSCSILLVEDEDAVRNVISLFLKKTGCTVYEAATPTVALELAADPSIQLDLVLTDYVMPGMNGKVMMERIHELRPQLLCIYASGFSTEQVQLGEDAHFIQKPYDLIKLSGLLKRVVSGREEQ